MLFRSPLTIPGANDLISATPHDHEVRRLVIRPRSGCIAIDWPELWVARELAHFVGNLFRCLPIVRGRESLAPLHLASESAGFALTLRQPCTPGRSLRVVVSAGQSIYLGYVMAAALGLRLARLPSISRKQGLDCNESSLARSDLCFLFSGVVRIQRQLACSDNKSSEEHVTGRALLATLVRSLTTIAMVGSNNDVPAAYLSFAGRCAAYIGMTRQHAGERRYAVSGACMPNRLLRLDFGQQ